MPNKTANYDLIKPLQTEAYNIDDQNNNMDKLDTLLAGMDSTKIDTKSTVADGDGFLVSDSAVNNKSKRILWSTIKTALGKLFTPLTRKINGKALSNDVTLTGADIAVSGSDVTSVSSALANKAERFTVMNIVPASAEEIWALEPGKYSWVQGKPLIWQPSDTPTGALRVLITVSSSETAAGTKTIDLRYVDGAIDRVSYMGEHTSAGIRWVKIATATPPAVYDLPLAAGWSAISAKYYRTQDGMITVNVLGLTNGSSAAGYSNWGILPEGFRPFTIILAPAINTSGWTITSAGQPTGTISETIFWSDGSLCIHRTDATTSQCSFNATFRAA